MKRLVLSGAAGAFGTAVTEAMSARGWQVVGLDLAGDEARGIIACDVTDPAATAAAFAQAAERLGGGVDAVLACAGIGGPVDSGVQPDARARAIVDVNLWGAWHLCAAAMPSLVKSRGRVVIVGSRMAFLGLPLGAAYAVSKRAVTAYADCLRAEYATHVSVTCIHPAMVRTPIHDATAAAGLSLDGVSTEEPLEGVVARIVEALEAARPGRDVAITRAGRVQIAVARHFPRVVDRVVARQIAKQVADGRFDDAPIATG